MVGLLDVNVLVALLVPEHEHHAAAMTWFAAESSQGWATCSVTELGVIRVCAQLPGGTWASEKTADRLLLLTAASPEYAFWLDAASPRRCPKSVRLPAPSGARIAISSAWRADTAVA